MWFIGRIYLTNGSREENKMDLVHIVVAYNDERRLKDAIDFIEDNSSKIKVKELNKALEWAGKNPKEYKGKYNKMKAILNYLKYEYMN